MHTPLRPVFIVLALLGAAAVPAQAATTTTTGPLTLSVSGPDQVAVGQSIALTVTTTNTSAVILRTVELGISFPQANARLVAPVANPDLCARGGNGGVSMGISCLIGDLQPGASSAITFGLDPLVAGTLGINAGATYFNNAVFETVQDGLSIPVAPAPTDVQISGSASTGSPLLGSTFSYNFQVKNGSGQPAYGVSFTDSVPQAETPLGAFTSSGAPCTISAQDVSCAIGDLAVGAQVTVTLTVRAPSVAGSLTNTASAFATNADTNLSNNTVGVTVTAK